jgi:hypothetical protein
MPGKTAGKGSKKLSRAARHGTKKILNPKIVGSKAHRHCGPYGYKLRMERWAKDNGTAFEFVTRDFTLAIKGRKDK